MIEKIVMKNLTSGVEIPIAREETPDYVLNYVDWGPVQGSQYTYKFAKQIGVYVASTSLGTRSVTIAGWIIAENEDLMTERKKKLNLFVNPQEDIQIEYNNKYLVFSPETSIQYSREAQKDNNEVIAQFKISGTAASPLFRDKDSSFVLSGNNSPVFHFPLIINQEDLQDSDDPAQKHDLPTIIFGVKQQSRLLLVTNTGTVPVGFTISMKANNSVVNPIVTNLNTQEFFRVNKTLAYNEEVEIETTIGSKHIYGKAENEEWENYFKYRDFNSTWLQLAVGDNVFQYDAEAGVDNLQLSIVFRNGYLEVEECY